MQLWLQFQSVQTTLGSLSYHDSDVEDNVNKKMTLYFTYKSRDTLKSFSSFLSVKTIVTKLNVGHSDKSEIKI